MTGTPTGREPRLPRPASVLTFGPYVLGGRWYRSEGDVAQPPPREAKIGGQVPEANSVVFRRAVLALSGGPTDEMIVRLACELARPTHAELIAVHVVELDWTKPLDADVAERSEEAQRVLDAAEGIADLVRGKIEAVLVQARDLGAAIVDEAAARDADLLILGLPYKTRFGGDFAVGRAVPYALKNAPCAVWVVREPMGEESR